MKNYVIVLTVLFLIPIFLTAQNGSSKEFTVNGITFSMITVEGGIFKMGATKDQKEMSILEKPVHEVELDGFMIGKFEVTQALWNAVMGKISSSNENLDYPVVYVSWNDCQEFIKKINELTGQTFRLPTEAEWEFAARGGTKSKKTMYAGGKKIKEVGFCWENSGDKPLKGEYNSTRVRKNNCSIKPVGKLNPNELGIYDMSGNVREWVNDYWGYYSSEPQKNPKGSSYDKEKIFRGGSWFDLEELCRVSNRSHLPAKDKGDHIGFRLAL